jgi:hypothetical protein
MFFVWICEKCGEENRSSQNLCKNAACRFVFHQTSEQKVTCAKCKREPVGGSLYRKGRNTTFPLKRLTREGLLHPDFDVYGKAGFKFLNALWPYVNTYLCQECHPDTLGLKVDSSLKSFEEADPRVKGRVLENDMAYRRIAKKVKENLETLRSENPDLTQEEEILLAKKMIRKMRDDEFITDEIDWKLRRIVRAGVVSRISFRKNIDHERFGESLYRFWRIEEARQRKDMSYLRKVLRQEAKRAKEIGEAIINDARGGPDLFSTIEEIRDLMIRKSDEIALKEHRIREEEEIGEGLYERVQVIGGRIERLAKAFTDSNDDSFLLRLGPILTRLRTGLSRAVEASQRFLSPIEVEVEREAVIRMQRKFMSHYGPLLHAATHLITWDIKGDMWEGPRGVPDEVKKSWGYFGRFAPIDRTKYIPPAFYVPGQDEPVYGLMPIRCEICDKVTQKIELLKYPDGQTIRVLVVCRECTIPPSDEAKKGLLERQKRLRTEWEEHVKLKHDESERKESQHRYNLDQFRNLLLVCMKMSMSDLQRIGVKYASPIFKLETGRETRIILKIVACPVSGVILPKRILNGGCETEIISAPSSSWKMAYLYHAIMTDLSKWKNKAKKLGYRLEPMGLRNFFGYVMDERMVARILGMEFPTLPMGYWKGVYKLYGMKDVHVNFRSNVEDGNIWDFEPMHPYGKPPQTEVDRQKAIKSEIKRRQTEDRKRWDPMTIRKKGGPSPKSMGKKTVKTPGVLLIQEAPMNLLSSTLVKWKMEKTPAYVVKDPATKDLSKFLMAAGPYRGDNYTHKPLPISEDKEFYRQKLSEALKDREGDIEAKKVSDKIWKRNDPKTFTKVKL